jgi:50S ribosomal subunit-associated GTPase HflX
VLNKVDRITPERARSLRAARDGSVLVSAMTGEGLGALGDEVARRLEMVPRRVRLKFPAADARAIAGVYSAGRVVAHQVEGDQVTIEVDIPERMLARFRENLA